MLVKSHKNRDGTYDIKFDDGERKSGVKTSKSNQRKNHHQKRNHQAVEVTTMTAMMMDMSVVIVLKLKLVDGLNIMVVKLHVKIEMVHMILNLMMVNVNQVLKQVKSNQRKNHHQKRTTVVVVTTMKVMLMVIMMDTVVTLKQLVDGLNIMVVKSHVKIEMVHMILNLMMVNVNQVLNKSNQIKKNHHQKRNHQVVEVTTMTAMMMDMSVVIVLKLKLVDGLNIMW